MFELDFLPVGEAGQSGDAIMARFDQPNGSERVHIIVDAGFQDTGEAVVDHFREQYGVDTVDVAIVTHPDGDHIGGMGHVLRNLEVSTLCIHQLGAHGGASLPAAKAVDELVALASELGTSVVEPFAGTNGFGGAVTILGPDEEWYESLVAEQVAVEDSGRRARKQGIGLAEAAKMLGQRILTKLPIEIPFDDDGGTSPRNNTGVITFVDLGNENRWLLTGDAGVPALDRAWTFLELSGRDTSPPNFIQIPHHGSRHNVSSDLLNRLLGGPGQEKIRTAFVSVTKDAPKHPSPRVVNAFMRRGCYVHQTAGSVKLHHGLGAAQRPGYSPATPMEPLDESDED